MLRIGVLLPRSTFFPSLGLDILDGLKQQLKQEGIFDSVKLITDNIGFGVEEQEIYTKAERMLLQEDADIVMLCADTSITEMLQPLFTASNKILLAVNFGANFPESWQAAPTTITHTLNFAAHAGLTGKLAATENKNRETINLISYYDGGYRQCYSMLSANQSAGGEAVFNYVTPIRLEEFSLEPLVEFLREHENAKTVLGLFSGEQAERFCREIAPLQKEYGLKLYGAPMLFEPSLQTSLGESFNIGELKGYIPWHASLDNKFNRKFLQMMDDAEKTANYFSLLGWEAGLIISEIHRQHAAGNKKAVAVITALTQVSLDSPRGWMKIDPFSLYSYGPSHLATCSGNMKVSIGSEADIEEEWKIFTSQPTLKGEASGWKNTYLCI